MDTREALKRFILQKIQENTSIDRPFYIIKWSGLHEMCKSLGVDLLELIDQMHEEGLIRKALLPTKKGKKILAVTLPKYSTSSKAKKLIVAIPF